MGREAIAPGQDIVDDLGRRLDHLIAHVMAVGVGDFLEIVDVEDGDRGGARAGKVRTAQIRCYEGR